MVRFLALLLLFVTNVSAQTLYCGQDTGLSDKVTLSNLMTYSQELDNAVWFKGNTTVSANSVIAPDGTLTADTLTCNAGTAQHYFYNNPAPAGLAAGNTERMLVYLKKGTQSYVSITNLYNDGVVVDLSTGAISPVSAALGLSSYSITSVGNGWYRVIVSYVKTNSGTRQLYVTFRTTGALVSGVPTSSCSGNTFYVWGMQLNNSTDPIDYIATTTPAATLAGVCASGTTQSPLDPSKCIVMSDRGREIRTEAQIAIGSQ